MHPDTVAKVRVTAAGCMVDSRKIITQVSSQVVLRHPGAYSVLKLCPMPQEILLP